MALVLTVGGLSLALRYPSGGGPGAADATDALSASAASGKVASGQTSAADGRRTGSRPVGRTGSRGAVTLGRVASTEWGDVQVQITVANRRIVAVQAVRHPNAGVQSTRINQRALPVLYRETLKAQSARVDAVSGATVTSNGYRQSLQSAIDLAHLA